MPRRVLVLIAAAFLAGAAGRASAQPVPAAAPPPSPQGVEITGLAAPDAFTTPGRATGLPPTLWTGASAQTAKTVLPLLAAKPLSLAAAALARRILATGAPGPEGAQRDPDLAAARANALMFQGDPKAAAAVLAHAPGLDRSSDLARAAAETALLTGDEARACKIGEALTVGRDETYWLKLRTYCQAIAGQTAQAQLTFDLVQAQAKDPTFARLMGAKIAGAGNPGAASLRNGLDYALSKSLGLDLAAAKPSPAVAAALTASGPTEPTFDALAAEPGLGEIAAQVGAGKPITNDALIAAASGTGKATARMPQINLLLVSLQSDTSPKALEFLEQSNVPEGKAPLGRNIAMDAAAGAHRLGEVALLALWTSAEAGAGGVAVGDRVRIVRALHAVGLERDARNFVLEGLAGLK